MKYLFSNLNANILFHKIHFSFLNVHTVKSIFCKYAERLDMNFRMQRINRYELSNKTSERQHIMAVRGVFVKKRY